MTLFYRLTQLFFRAFFWIFYRHKTYGIDNLPEGPALIAANHTSFFDPPIISASAPCSLDFLARDTLFRHPVFACLIRKLNAHPISGVSNNLTSFKLILKLIKEGRKVVIFPEGERSPTGELMEIKPGIGMLAMKAGVPIVPTYIHGAFAIWPITKKYPKLHGKTRCVFGHPIFIEDYSHLDHRAAQEAIVRDVGLELARLRDWYTAGNYGPLPH